MRMPDGRLHPNTISGAGAAPGDALLWKGTHWAPGAAGGGPLGYAAYSVYAPSDMPSDSDYQDNNGLTLDTSVGAHGVSVSGTTVTYADGDLPGIYVVAWSFKIIGARNASNNVLPASDVSQVSYFDRVVGESSHVFLGPSGGPYPYPTITGAGQLRTATALSFTPSFRWRSSATTNTYDIDQVTVHVTRLADA